jgi:hypothetical protein
MPNKSLGTLTLDLIARIGGFVDGLSKAERESKKRSDGISKSLKSVGTAAGAMAAGVAVGTSALIKSQIDLADQFSKQSAILGVAIEEWSALNYAADLSDVSNEQLSASITKLNKNIVASVDGTGAAADAFNVLGVSVKNTDGTLKDSYTVLTEVADAFAGIEDGATKTALAQDLLGKSGAKMIPLLNGGAEGLAAMRKEAEQLGQVIDADTGKAAEEFNDNLTRLQKVISGTGNQLAKELAPALAEFTGLINDPETQQSIKDLVRGLAEITIGAVQVTSAIVGAARSVGEFFAEMAVGINTGDPEKLAAAIGDIQTSIENYQDALASSKDSDFSLAEQLLGAPERIRADLRKSISEAEAELSRLTKIRDLMTSLGAGQTSTGKAASSEDPEKKSLKERTQELEKLLAKLKEQKDAETDLANQQKEIQNAFDSALEGYKEQAIAIGDVTEAQKARFEIEQGSLKALSAEQKTQILQAAEMADAYKLLGEAAEEAGNNQAEANREVRAIADDLRTQEEKIRESYNRRREIILQNTEITGQKQSDLLRKLEEKRNEDLLELNGSYWEKWLAAAEKNLQNFDELSGEIINNFSSRFGDAAEEVIFELDNSWESLEDSGKKVIEGLARSTVNALGQMAAQWLAYQAVQLLVGKTTQAAAVPALIANASAASLQAGINAFASTAAIPIVGPAAAPAAMSAAIAATSPLVASISSLAAMGMAHDGIDSVPKTGTWLLEKGERVTTERTSAKLDRTLDEIRAGQNRRMGNNVTNNFNISTPNSDSFRMSQRQIMKKAKKGLNG